MFSGKTTCEKICLREVEILHYNVAQNKCAFFLSFIFSSFFKKVGTICCFTRGDEGDMVNHLCFT